VDPDPAIFVIDLQDAKDKKVKKNLQSSRNQGFSYYFCLVIEGSGSRSRTPKTYGFEGSGSESAILLARCRNIIPWRKEICQRKHELYPTPSLYCINAILQSVFVN
jgi:hypothetical protein